MHSQFFDILLAEDVEKCRVRTTLLKWSSSDVLAGNDGGEAVHPLFEYDLNGKNYDQNMAILDSK